MTPESFIRRIVHDVQAPLRGMKEVPDWIEQDLRAHLDPIPTPVLDLLQLMKSQASQLDTIVTGLREIATLQRSDETARVRLQGNAVFEDLPGNLAQKIEAQTAPLEQDHLSLVIKHLVDNAYQHAHAAERAAVLLIAEVDSSFYVAVRDYGPGIGEEFRARVFDPLFTLKSRDELEKSGMGLAIVSKIAELYGGKCIVRPNENSEGMTFGLTIPLQSP